MLYQRGNDGFPIGADKYHRDQRGPIPNAEVFVAPHGVDKPLKVHGWQWSTDFNKWSARVTFSNGWTGVTYPTHHTLDDLERAGDGEYLVRATVPACDIDHLVKLLQDACDEGVAGTFTVRADGDRVRIVFARSFAEDSAYLLAKTAREQLACELVRCDQSDRELTPVVQALRGGDSAEFLPRRAVALREHGRTDEGHQVVACDLPREFGGITAVQMVALAMEREEAFADLVRGLDPLDLVTTTDLKAGFELLRRRFAGEIILP